MTGLRSKFFYIRDKTSHLPIVPVIIKVTEGDFCLYVKVGDPSSAWATEQVVVQEEDGCFEFDTQE